MTHDPRTPAEWQTAVDCAEACLLLDSARQYGLIKGGPVIDVFRCDEILRRGRERQIVPAKSGVDAHIQAFTVGNCSTRNSPPLSESHGGD